jgi:hypothetical protein
MSPRLGACTLHCSWICRCGDGAAWAGGSDVSILAWESDVYAGLPDSCPLKVQRASFVPGARGPHAECDPMQSGCGLLYVICQSGNSGRNAQTTRRHVSDYRALLVIVIQEGRHEVWAWVHGRERIDWNGWQT